MSATTTNGIDLPPNKSNNMEIGRSAQDLTSVSAGKPFQMNGFRKADPDSGRIDNLSESFGSLSRSAHLRARCVGEEEKAK